MNSKLDVRSTGLDTNFTNDGECGVAHHLVFLVGQGLHRRNGDGIAGVHAHGIEILDRTNDHAVVHPVAHHFHFELFPADQRFFDQHFAHWRKIQSARSDLIEFLAIVSNAATGTAQGECRTNNQRKCSNLGDDLIEICN